MWYRMAALTAGLLRLVSPVLRDSKGQAIQYRPKNQPTWVLFNMEILTFQILGSNHDNKPRHSFSWHTGLHTSGVRVACVVPMRILLRPHWALQPNAYWETHLIE
jgi:hypothetical protein